MNRPSAEDPIGAGHGMGTALEIKDWANLSSTDIQDLTQDYPELSTQSEQELRILWHSPRPFSSAAIVATSQRQYFIKRTHHSFRCVLDIQQEHDFIVHLQKKGIVVPQLLRNRHGATVTQQHDWVYEVHHKIDAVDVYADLHSWQTFFYPQHAYAAAESLAKLHQAARDFKQQARQTHYLLSNHRLLDHNNLVDAITQRIAEDVALNQYFEQHVYGKDDHAFAQFKAQVTAQHRTLIPVMSNQIRLWTHNDLHASNLLWSEHSAQAQVAAVIDFGLADRSSIVYDFAVAIERNFIDWLQLDWPQHQNITIDLAGLTQFIQGYLNAGGESEQIRHVAKMLPLAHIDFALYELVYFLEITENAVHADAAYRYLLDHTAWFCSKQGQHFLAQLDQLMLNHSKL